MKKRYWIPLLLALLASPLVWQAWTGNFHTVVPGEVYRSAQLSPEDLIARVDENGIRSVLNLRGPDPGKEWYDGEMAATRQHNVTHADFLMTASSPLKKEQMDKLVTLMQSMPKPVLIHCWGGADRTGLASALYLYAVQHQSAGEAGGQLSFRYGHVPYLFWSKTQAMDDSFRVYIESTEKDAAGAAALPDKK